MQPKVLKFGFDKKELFKEAEKIRIKVFVEEQNTDFDEEFDGLDDKAEHFLIFFDNKPVGTSRVRITKEGVKIERFAVLKQYRRKNTGAELLKKILEEYLPLNQKIYLNAQVQAMKFYEKFGFKKTGKLFYEANIKHYKMIYSD